MRVSNPTYTRDASAATNPKMSKRFHIFDSTNGVGDRFMLCDRIYDRSRALEMRFDFEPVQIRQQVCGICRRKAGLS